MNRFKLIPSMFHRRLVLLATVTIVVAAILILQLLRLSVVQGAERRETAESRLRRHSFLETYRGRILDRDGLILAQDRAADAVAVRYDVMTGEWELRRATADARREHGARWRTMSPEERDAAIARHLPTYTALTDRLWREIIRLGRIDDAELAQRRNAIKRDVQTAAAAHWTRHLRQEITESQEDDNNNQDEGPSAEPWRPEPIREQRAHHVILPQVSTDVAYAFRKLAEDLSRETGGTFGGTSGPSLVEVQYSPMREYPWTTVDVRLDRSTLPLPLRSAQGGETSMLIRVDGVADHILGAVRHEVWKEDVQRRPFRDRMTGNIDLGWYRPGDTVGSRGLEAVFEDHLRGLRGMVEERRDTGQTVRTDPVPGSDLYTTLDIRLQAKVQAILSPEFGLTRVHQYQAGWDSRGEPRDSVLPIGFPLRSAAVVLDIETGHILALVSMPTLAMGDEMSERRRAFEQPWVNRAAEAVYPPGSILKPMVAVAAHAEGLFNPDSPIQCTGHYFPDLTDAARCWIYREPVFATHGPLQLEEAMARSCNIYFYTLGDRLGMSRMSDWLSRFGLGQMLDVGLAYEISLPGATQGAADGADRGADRGATAFAGEVSGSVPSEEVIARFRRDRQDRFASAILGIGQGPVTWTPLQAANAYATLARNGEVRDATLIMSDPRPQTMRRSESNLNIDPRIVRRINEGLRQSVMEHYGTGYAIRYPDGTSEPIVNVRGVTVWAKTGTAQALPLRLPPREGEEEERVITNGTHAWFVGLVGSEEYARPQYAVAVLVEYGGSGGRTAGPIANQIIRALQEMEYLPSD